MIYSDGQTSMIEAMDIKQARKDERRKVWEEAADIAKAAMDLQIKTAGREGEIYRLGMLAAKFRAKAEE